MSKIVLSVKNLTITNIFQDFSINFEENKLTTVSGPNNCGKTTLIRLLGDKIYAGKHIYLHNKLIGKYSNVELNKLIKTIIPTDIYFSNQDINSQIVYECSLTDKEYKDYSKDTKKLAKKLQITDILTKTINSLTISEKIKLRLLFCLVNNTSILLLDDIYKYLDNEDSKLIQDILLSYKDKMTIIQTVSNLEDSINSDYLYIIRDSKIILEGAPLTVIQQDNTINKLGLEIPFMIDLSVKLRDYNLVDKILLDKKALVEEIWH